MLSQLLSLISSMWFMILHVSGTGSFPKPLKPEEEEKYLKLFKQTNDIKVRNILVEHNLRLVAHIIKKYNSLTQDKDDLVSIGTIGLIKALNTFDPDKNIKLSSYASRCIENEILMYFRNIRKTSQDISLNETIDTDKDGNPLTLMDVMASDDNISDMLDLKINSEKLRIYVNECLTPREKRIII